MKKLTIFILTIFTVATLFAAARPSLDGRAVVAESGSMPRGLFARTVGYLPGDSVTVTNPATGSTIDVLVLGAIDPSEGVAILLSPESAEALRIKPDSNVQVKLTKRAGSLDENANGSAVLSEGDDESLTDSSEIASSDVPNEEASYTPVPTKREVHKAVVIQEEEPAPQYEEVAAVPEPAENTEVVEEIPAVAEKPSEPYEEIPVVREVENTEPVVAKNTEVPETLYEEVPPIQTEDETLQKVVLIGATEEKVEAPVEEEAVSADGELVAAEETVPENGDEALQQVIVVEKEVLVDANGDLQPVIEELPVYVEESRVVAEELPDGVEAEPEVEIAYADDMPYSEEEIDAYQPIVLVPTDENPPSAGGEPVSAENPENTEEEAVAFTDEPSQSVVAVEEKPVVTNDWSNYVVPSVKNLRSGSYYVQVASLGNEENIKNFVDKYSDKYPVVLVQNGAKTAYQVMVGPLNIDEYGAVGEKFKDYGFKDSFVRKIR